MSRYRDNSGIDHTCPKIDEVISAIDSVNWGEDSYWDAKTVTEIMEKIRKAKSRRVLLIGAVVCLVRFIGSYFYFRTDTFSFLFFGMENIFNK